MGEDEEAPSHRKGMPLVVIDAWGDRGISQQIEMEPATIPSITLNGVGKKGAPLQGFGKEKGDPKVEEGCRCDLRSQGAGYLAGGGR